MVETYQNDRYVMPPKVPAWPDAVPSLADVKSIAEKTENIIVLSTPKRKARRRHITRRQIELCCQRGTFIEGPFKNEKLDWQVTMYRHAAGEELRVIVIIKDGKLIVRSNH